MGAMMSELYTHNILGKFSPQNGCFSEDESQLFIIPLDPVPLRDAASHEFSCLKNPNVKSRFGWVKATRPFSITEFLLRIPVGVRRDEALINHLETMLRVAKVLKPGDAVAVDYMRRGVETQRMELSVHKVFFASLPMAPRG